MLGDAFDYSINACGIAGDEFIKLFLASTACSRMENGEPAYLAGKSGIELAIEVVYETTGREITEAPQVRFDRSAEYWVGWAVAYYQWYSCRRYSEIFEVLPFEDLLQMYCPLHEADITKFADIADERIRAHFSETNLKRIRVAYGCTQSELAKNSNISLRSVQMYEQRNKDINKASVATVYRLAQALGCKTEDLMER